MRWLVILFALVVMNPARIVGQGFDKTEVERAEIQVLDDFMAAFNATDGAAVEATLHFPHFRLASGGMQVLQDGPAYEARLAQVFPTLRSSGWHHSDWNRRNIVHAGPSKVHIDTQFTRYREDGSVIASYESLYIVTLEDGRWGIKMRSSFAR